MQSDAVTFAVDAQAPPELALAAAGLAAGLADLGRPCEVLLDPWPETLTARTLVIEVGAAETRARGWRLAMGPAADLALTGPHGRSSPLPLPIPPLPPCGHFADRLFIIGGGANRRMRMLMKLFDALRAHPGIEAVVWRELPEDVLRQRLVAEVHPDLRSEELARLLGSAAALVEVSDEPTPEALLLAALGRASGIPTVVHEALAGGRNDLVAVGEWSGEAFADAAVAAAKRSRNEGAASALRKDAAERFAGALVS